MLSTSQLILGALFSGCLSAYIAQKRGRSPYRWFWVGFCFGVVGVLTTFFAPVRKKVLVVAAPPPTLSGPTNKIWYYLDAAHEKVGPMSHDSLTAFWRAGKITLMTYVWHEELPEWKPLKDFTSLP